IFYIPDEGRTLAELSTDEKNRLSHRSQGLQAILPLLKEVVK
ncbi:MAG: non-canonical purine NTP pyrophosphatase, partial [Elusimicrobia bacterium]|nr:non-canonical purine NTP pyrophosphatase [Elusimicrobiota bacterium]